MQIRTKTILEIILLLQYTNLLGSYLVYELITWIAIVRPTTSLQINKQNFS